MNLAPFKAVVATVCKPLDLGAEAAMVRKIIRERSRLDPEGRRPTRCRTTEGIRRVATGIAVLLGTIIWAARAVCGPISRVVAVARLRFVWRRLFAAGAALQGERQFGQPDRIGRPPFTLWQGWRNIILMRPCLICAMKMRASDRRALAPVGVRLLLRATISQTDEGWRGGAPADNDPRDMLVLIAAPLRLIGWPVALAAVSAFGRTGTVPPTVVFQKTIAAMQRSPLPAAPLFLVAGGLAKVSIALRLMIADLRRRRRRRRRVDGEPPAKPPR
jgi:hypothetical protein